MDPWVEVYKKLLVCIKDLNDCISYLLMYKHLSQKKNFCGPACVQMVLFKRDSWLDQEEIAHALDVHIAKEDQHLYTLPFKLATKEEQLGVDILDFNKQDVKDFFKRFNLTCEAHLISNIKNAAEFITTNLKQCNDVMANFWWIPIKDKDFGHFVLITELKNDIVTICDPSYEQKSVWKCELSKLVKGMSSEWTGKERGFVVISQT